MIAMHMNYNSVLLQMMDSIPYGDKVAHFFVVGTLTFFANILLNRRKTDFFITPVLLGSVLVCAFVSLDEVAQMFVEHRNCEMFDFLANFAGIYVFGKLGNQIPETLLPKRKLAFIP